MRAKMHPLWVLSNCFYWSHTCQKVHWKEPCLLRIVGTLINDMSKPLPQPLRSSTHHFLNPSCPQTPDFLNPSLPQPSSKQAGVKCGQATSQWIGIRNRKGVKYDRIRIRKDDGTANVQLLGGLLNGSPVAACAVGTRHCSRRLTRCKSSSRTHLPATNDLRTRPFSNTLVDREHTPFRIRQLIWNTDEAIDGIHSSVEPMCTIKHILN